MVLGGFRSFHVLVTTIFIQGSYSLELFKFHDLFKFFKTFGLALTYKNFKNFPCFTVFLDFEQFNRHKRWCPVKCELFVLADYSSLSYNVLALSSICLTYLSNKTSIFHDFPGPTWNLILKFHDFLDLENTMLKFYDFPGLP